MVTPAQGLLLLLFGTLTLGGMPLVVAWVDVEPLTLAALRCLLSLPVLLPLVLWELRRVDRSLALPRRTMIGAAVAGAALGADYSLWNFSISLIGPGLATVLLNIQLVILPFIAWLLEGTRPMRQLALIVPLMLAGVGLAAGAFDALLPGSSGGADIQLRGVLLALLAGCGYATYLAVMRRTSPSTPRPAPFTVLAIACLSAGTAALGASLVTGRFELPGTAPDWGGVLVLAVIGQVLAFICLNIGMVSVHETAASTILLLPGVFAVVLGAALLQDIPTAWQLAGCVLIILGAWWAVIASRRHYRSG